MIIYKFELLTRREGKGKSFAEKTKVSKNLYCFQKTYHFFQKLIQMPQKGVRVLKILPWYVHFCFLPTFCSDFRYESNGIFVLGVGFFFFRQISTF